MLSVLVGTVHNAGGLYALRFLLGFVEAAFYPGALFLISSWYKREEMGVRRRIPIFRIADGAHGLESWRWIFIIEGSITVFIALCSIIILPDYPSNTRWLSPTERAVAEWRLISDAGLVDEGDSGWLYGFKQAFADWRLYIFDLTLLYIQVASATLNLFPAVVETLGFNRVDTILLTFLPYMVSVILMVANNWSTDRLGNSSFHVIWPLVLAIVGYVTAAASINTGARYFAIIAMVPGDYCTNPVLVSWTQKVMIRPRVKRASAVAFCRRIWKPCSDLLVLFIPR